MVNRFIHTVSVEFSPCSIHGCDCTRSETPAEAWWTVTTGQHSGPCHGVWSILEQETPRWCSALIYPCHHHCHCDLYWSREIMPRDCDERLWIVSGDWSLLSCVLAIAVDTCWHGHTCDTLPTIVSISVTRSANQSCDTVPRVATPSQWPVPTHTLTNPCFREAARPAITLRTSSESSFLSQWDWER